MSNGDGQWDSSQMERGRVAAAEVATLAAGLLSLDRPDWQTHSGPHPHLHLYPHLPLLVPSFSSCPGVFDAMYKLGWIFTAISLLGSHTQLRLKKARSDLLTSELGLKQA